MTKNGTEREKQKPIQVLDRALSILSIIASRRQPISLHDIALMAQLHPATVHRLLWNLAEQDYLQRDENGRWSLGLRFLHYGSLVRDRLDVREKALPLMHVLFEKTGQTINLSMRHEDHVMYVEHVLASHNGLRLTRQIGSMAPLHCTSGGKLFLSEFSPEDVSAYIARTRLARRTEHSIASAERLIPELDRIRELGWADDKEELEHGIRCIGAPIRDHQGRIIAAITIVSSSDMSQKPEWVRHLLSTCAAVSAGLGWLGQH